MPGQVTAPLSFGPHVLLRYGAYLVAEPLDVLTRRLRRLPAAAAARA